MQCKHSNMNSNVVPVFICPVLPKCGKWWFFFYLPYIEHNCYFISTISRLPQHTLHTPEGLSTMQRLTIEFYSLNNYCHFFFNCGLNG